jgi:hypothetical protein
VTRLCKALNVSPSGYYAYRRRPVSAREMANRELVDQAVTVMPHPEGANGHEADQVGQVLGPEPQQLVE